MLDFLMSASSDLATFNSNFGVKGLFDWIQEQAKWLLFGAFIIILLVTMIKRAWIAAVGLCVGFALVGVFVLNPDSLLGLSRWLSDMLSL